MEVFGRGKGKKLLLLSKTRSNARRVIWESLRRPWENDEWDGYLLDTVRKAATWVEQRFLCSELDLGLERLGRGDVVPADPPGITVALCVATKNRLWQLRRALPLNLLHCWPHRGWTRLHVVDFGSTDGTLQFLLGRCRPAIACGLLRVYSTDQLPHWHASVAKNTAHAVAGEEVLVNLDGDNLVGPGFPSDVARHFAEGFTALQYEDGEGTCGRIACRRADFHRLRGYDEDALPMGAQDVDLVLRLKALPGAHFKRVRGRSLSQAIPNSQDLKVACCSPLYGGLRWGRMDALNKEVFAYRRAAGQLARNLDREQIGVWAWLAH